MNSSIKHAFATVVACSAIFGGQAKADAWLTSYSKALQISAKTGKPVLVDFTGSDWCHWCVQLHHEVFDTPVFKKWAAKNVVLLELDYPHNTPQSPEIKKQNEELLKKYPVRGFPTIYFLKSNGKAFGMYYYDQGGPAHWTAMADRLINPTKTTGTRPLKFADNAKGYPPKVDKELYADNDLRGKTAPKLTVEKWLTGKAPDTAGKVVIIDFWATWCPSCRDLIPELAVWKKKYAKDVVIIGVSDEKPQIVANFMKKMSMPYNVAIDTTDKTSKLIGIRSIPQVLVITPDHVVRWQGYPKDQKDLLTDEVLQRIIDTSKGKKVVAQR